MQLLALSVYKEYLLYISAYLLVFWVFHSVVQTLLVRNPLFVHVQIELAADEDLVGNLLAELCKQERWSHKKWGVDGEMQKVAGSATVLSVAI